MRSDRSPRSWMMYSNLGFLLMTCAGLGVALGWWLDETWGTQPWMLLAGSLLGVTSGMYHFLKAVLAAGRETPPDEKETETDEHR